MFKGERMQHIKRGTLNVHTQYVLRGRCVFRAVVHIYMKGE